eukprot:GHVO01032704.1.p1 GENE.GHVO01032704.1~~GHVO01032704.1.p1  ORF type:complete len:140 (+),score=4.81 GHVO01032704.1:51-470(+)
MFNGFNEFIEINNKNVDMSTFLLFISMNSLKPLNMIIYNYYDCDYFDCTLLEMTSYLGTLNIKSCTLLSVWACSCFNLDKTSYILGWFFCIMMPNRPSHEPVYQPINTREYRRFRYPGQIRAFKAILMAVMTILAIVDL